MRKEINFKNTRMLKSNKPAKLEYKPRNINLDIVPVHHNTSQLSSLWSLLLGKGVGEANTDTKKKVQSSRG